MTEIAEVGDVYEFIYPKEPQFNCSLKVTGVRGNNPDDFVFFNDGTNSKQKNLVRIQKNIIDVIVNLPIGTTARDFCNRFSKQAWDTLNEVHPDGQKGTIKANVSEFGKVSVYLGACSDGADRGGYVIFIKLHNFLGPNKEPIVLEEDHDEWLFEPRTWRL